MKQKAFLVLENGDIYSGFSFGAKPPLASKINGNESFGLGEVVFNTAMSGYYEVLTDPSYTGQLVLFTYPHIGNYGVDKSWSEVAVENNDRNKIKASGLIVKSLYSGPVSANREKLEKVLLDSKVFGIEGIDTRKLTIYLRENGSLNGVIVRATDKNAVNLSDFDLLKIREYFNQSTSMEGKNLIGKVGCVNKVDNPIITGSTVLKCETNYKYKIAILDCGLKANIVREFQQRGCQVTLFPSTSTKEEILKIKPDAFFISNGPGDPAVLTHQIELAKSLFNKLPVFGICLGHQIISLALGAKTYKMKFGHHGLNHPVRDEFTKRVFVTSQNHGFAVDEKSLPKDVKIWLKNANDYSIEGIVHKSLPIMSVQFHPEACPGPIDVNWIFDAFLNKIKNKKLVGEK